MVYINELFTENGTRLRQLSSGKINILLVPGGPGMGSEYLHSLGMLINNNFGIWLLDLPNNGDNKVSGKKNYNDWTSELVQAAKMIDNCVVLGHSFGGMLALMAPELEQQVKALILMSTIPANIFDDGGRSYYEEPEVASVIKNLTINPSDNNFKELVVKLSHLYFKNEFLKDGVKVMQSTNYCVEAYFNAREQLMATYEAKYTPSVPTLIISGQQDIVTPIDYFKQSPKFNNKDNIEIKSIPNCNHFPWIEQPEQIQQSLLEFISKIETVI